METDLRELKCSRHVRLKASFIEMGEERNSPMAANHPLKAEMDTKIRLSNKLSSNRRQMMTGLNLLYKWALTLPI